MSDRRYAWYVLAILSLINFMNYLDRQIMFALYPYVQEDLGLTDTQLGLLAPAFLIVHSLFSIPGGVLADRWFKRKVIAIGVSLWSLATLLGSIARSFAELFVYRALVGVGEAAYGPAANALISDYFPLGERGRAMGLFSVGMVIGGGAGMVAGTVIGDYLGWRFAFLVAGIPGFVLGALSWRLREVKVFGKKAEPIPEGHAVPLEGVSWRRLLRTPTVRYTFAGGICITFCIGGLIAWMVSFLDRYFVAPAKTPTGAVTAPAKVGAVRGAKEPGTPPEAPGTPPGAPGTPPEAPGAAKTGARVKGKLAGLGISFGVIALVAGLLGTISGGYLADRLMRWRRSGRLLVSAGGFLLGTPFCAIGLFSDSPTLFLVCLFLAIYFFVWYTGPIIAILHDVVAYRYRATIAAAYIFAIHLLGDAISPPIVGWISEHSELRLALLLPVGMAVLGSIFLLLATRTVHRDMEAAAREGAAETLAVEASPASPATGV